MAFFVTVVTRDVTYVAQCSIARLLLLFLPTSDISRIDSGSRRQIPLLVSLLLLPLFLLFFPSLFRGVRLFGTWGSQRL